MPELHGRALSASERAARIREAHYNVLALDGADVEVDLSTDVPRLAVLPEVREAAVDVSLGGAYGPALDDAARELYGPALYAWAGRGRSAELAMASSLIHKGSVVLGNGLFRTTQVAFRRAGAHVELEPGGPPRPGSSDLDLKWLELRLQDGDVAWVCLEASNNALAGWPQSLDNIKAVRALCDRYRAGLLLDATRLFGACLLIDPSRDPRELAKEITALADAFWVSCAKELISPVGAFLAVRSLEVQRKAFNYMFDEGTWLDGIEARARVLRGMQAIAHDVAPLRARRHQVELVAETLRKAGTRILEPTGAYAVFVPVDAELLLGSPGRARALESLLYERAGVRVLISPYSRMAYTAVIRVAITVGRYQDGELVRAAEAIAALLRDPSGALNLVEQPSPASDPVHDIVKCYTTRS